MADEKLVKVQLTYDSGRVQTLESDDAEAWIQNVKSCILINLVHPAMLKMKQYPWKETHVEQDKS